MNPEKQMNLTMLCDYYELTMTNGYYACGMQNRITYFDIFFRSVPDGRRLCDCGRSGAGHPLYPAASL